MAAAGGQGQANPAPEPPQGSDGRGAEDAGRPPAVTAWRCGSARLTGPRPAGFACVFLTATFTFYKISVT